ncbi:MAG: M1 family metallopeptidase [Gemmatimonadetes bacterium]|nr:M1 family metallopeptidase [Gemmatimonadota bacterium]
MPRLFPLVGMSLVLAGCATPRAAPRAESGAAPLMGQPARPIPYPVTPPENYQRAIERGTRTRTGEPGPRYWQQWTNYRLRATLDARARRVDGTAQLTYHNRSPDTLAVVFLHLHQNLHAPGAMRNEPQEVTGGVTLRRVSAAGQTVRAVAGQATGYQVDGTRMAIRLPRPLLPRDSVRLEVDWGFRVPQAGAGRMGYDADNLFFIAYWFPQMAVYDDVVGWQTDPYLGNAEFYLGYGSYDVAITAPEGWVLLATGELRNEADVLPAPVMERLRRARQSDQVVTVLSSADFGPGRATRRGTNGRLTWQFRADSVRDFSWSATRQSQWDAARTPVGDRNGDGRIEYAQINSLWRASAPLWREVARYSQHSIAFLSRYTGVPYPYPHMTAVEGENIIGGGMEFPMMTLMGSYTQRGDTALYAVTAHELAHMWIPMIVGSDEKRYAWMDEGTTTFNENQAKRDFFPGAQNFDLEDQISYLRAAQANVEGEMMRWTDYHYPGPAGTVASYMKPATALVALRAILGEETFNRGLRTFMQSWSYRHPYPWDMWNTFERVSGRDLDWFWRSWYYESWTLDHAVANVTTGPGGSTITIEDRGMLPMPARLLITRADGSSERREVPVERWLSGARTATVTVPGTVTRVEIDPELVFPDINRTNNVWTR